MGPCGCYHLKVLNVNGVSLAGGPLAHPTLHGNIYRFSYN